MQQFADENNLGYQFASETLGGVCIHKGDDTYIFMFEDKISTIMHECVHAAQMSLDYRGVPTGVENTEGVAYLAAWIFDECLGFFADYFDKQKVL